MTAPSLVIPIHKERPWIYHLLFFGSGFPALIYQIVWQRSLFTLYGVNIESVTMIVAVFMLGLGLGSLAGGWLSARRGIRLLLTFGSIEILVGSFGAASLGIFHHVGAMTAGASTFKTGLVAFALLLFPTLLMGSTLPLLVEHFVRRNGNVGESVGSLYSVNTVGAAVACFAAAFFLMRIFGESGSVRVAVLINLGVGISALILGRGQAATVSPSKLEVVRKGKRNTIPIWLGGILAGTTGFVALAYEILWYRLYSFTTGGTAPSFAKLLAYYLLGIAYGSLAVRDVCRQKAGNDIQRILAIASQVVLLGAIASFVLGPVLARWATLISYEPSYVLVFVAAALLGSAFPLLSHATIDPTRSAGKHISFLYLSNILGSTLGSFLVGFVLLDHWSTRATSVLLLGLSVAVAIVLALLAGVKGRTWTFGCACLVCLILALTSGAIYSGMYERLLFKGGFQRSSKFTDLVENRSGVIAVDATGIIYGGGAYDGRFNTDLVHDTNGLFRAFAIPALHPHPKDVLIVGLSSGSWAQVVANNPEVMSITIVEINPGYLPLIQKYPEVASLLMNPKVHIVIDDGRRWLISHPERTFDFILMNTTFNWRANVSNLLSTEFLSLVRVHLNPGGIEYYNTTGSEAALATGVAAFPYALRFANFLAVSDSPIAMDKDRWKSALSEYKIDGHAVFDLENRIQRQRLNEVLHMADGLDTPGGLLESRASMVARLKGVRLITDDNMGTEWR